MIRMSVRSSVNAKEFGTERLRVRNSVKGTEFGTVRNPVNGTERYGMKFTWMYGIRLTIRNVAAYLYTNICFRTCIFYDLYIWQCPFRLLLRV